MRENIRDVNKSVKDIFDMSYYIQVGDVAQKQCGTLTLSLAEDVFVYLQRSWWFDNVHIVIRCNDYSKKYSTSLVPLVLPLLRFSTRFANVKYLHNELGYRKTLLVASVLCGWLSLASFKNKGNNFVTPEQAAKAVAKRLLTVAVSLIVLEKTKDGKAFLTDQNCCRTPLHLPIDGI